MEKITILFLFLINCNLNAQPVEPVQVEYEGKLYWKYQSVDVPNNTPFKFYYQYDSAGQYLGWVYEFPRDGAWINFYKEDSTQVASIFHIQDSLLTGISTQYYLEGGKWSEYEFYQREESGFVRYWSKKGQLTLEHQYEFIDYGHFQSSIQVGEWKSWDDNGNLIVVENFKKGDRHGVQLEYHENGALKREEFYKNGKSDSLKTNYHPNGQIQSRFRFQDGVCLPENPHYEYHANGQVAGVGGIMHELKADKWTFFYKNGKKESEGNYKIYTYPHEHGDLYYSLKVGKWDYWYASGTLKASGTYQQRELDGLNEDEGAAKLRREKDWRYYNEKGKELTLPEFEQQEIQLSDL